MPSGGGSEYGDTTSTAVSGGPASMGVRRVLPAILAGALTSLLLSACGGGDDSIADPPISSAPTSSPTTSSARETPEHFIRRFVAVSNSMEMRGPTDRYMALTLRCKPCRALAQQIETARSHGGFYHSTGWSIGRVKTDVTRASGTVDVSV